MDKERFTGPVIVTMKGPPHSGKSTLAQLIANSLKYLLIPQDDCIADLQQALITTDIDYLYDLSLSIIYQIVETQLCLGHRVIIDASLHLRSYLEQLQKLSKSTGARLVIVECKPQERYEHVKRAEEVAAKLRWYKPSTPEDLERLVKLYDDEWFDDHDVSIAYANTSKLVVDTTGHVRDWDLTSGVKYLACCHDCHRMNLHEWVNDIWQNVDGDLWKQENEETEIDTYSEEEKSHHHHQLVLTNYKRVNDDDDKETCRGCLELISGPSYYKCSECNCSLSVHKHCAELTHKKELLVVPRNCPKIEYSFPEKHNCDNEDDEHDYDQCVECFFETNLRCGTLPSVLHHNCHEHPLCIKTYPISFGFEFKCKACCYPGEHICYRCDVCGFVIHPHCGLLPQTFKDTFHRHSLSLTLALPHDEYDKFYCDACEKPRNPNNWIYYCEECDFACHLNCDI